MRHLTPFRLSLAIAVLFIGLMVAYEADPSRKGPLTMLAERSLDLKFALRGWQPVRTKIVILSGDEASFKKYGERPWDRGAIFAPIIESLCGLGVKAIGFDFLWTDAERLIAPRLGTKLSLLLADKPGIYEQALSESSGNALMRRAISECGQRVVLTYVLSPGKDPDRTDKEFAERAGVVLHPEARNRIDFKVDPGVVLAERIGDARATLPFPYNVHSGVFELPEITPPDVPQGFANFEADPDGLFRRTQMFYWFPGVNVFVPSFALRIAQLAIGNGDAPARGHATADGFSLELPGPRGVREIPVDPFGRAVVNYHGPEHYFPWVSVAQLLDDGDSVDYSVRVPPHDVEHRKVLKTELFKDAIVLFSYTVVGSNDTKSRPLAGYAMGVENHAEIINDILDDGMLSRPLAGHPWLYGAGALVVSALYAWALSRMNARSGALLAGGALVGTFALDQLLLFNELGVVVFGLLIELQLVFQYLAVALLKYAREEEEKKRIRQAFDKYVSPAIIDTMLKDPSKLRLGGEKRAVSILFSDIRGFTTLSEKLDVRTLTHLLNDYLGAMTNILQANSGTLDKYIGDAVMGFWSAPIEMVNHAHLAAKTAVEMLLKLEELNPSFEQRYGVRLDIGIGINTGEVSVGNFGSEKVFEYTVIGDNVNLASRLEGVTKKYGARIIVSESTFLELPAGEFQAREIDMIRVKGKQKPVKIYEVFPDTPAYASLKASAADFCQALTHYYQRRWAEAIALLANVVAVNPSDKAAAELLDRCREYEHAPPPADWDGSYEMDSK